MSDEKQLRPSNETLSDENLRIVYQEVCRGYHAIDDFRTKLLGFLPLVSGAGIFLLLNDAFTDVAKRAFAKQYLLPLGIFGFVVTLGLFFYELRGIQRCDSLLRTGKDLEGLLGVRGQFERRPPIITAVGEPLAAYVIYSALLAVWIFVAFVFIWSQWTGVLALVVFAISLAGSYI